MISRVFTHLSIKNAQNEIQNLNSIIHDHTSKLQSYKNAEPLLFTIVNSLNNLKNTLSKTISNYNSNLQLITISEKLLEYCKQTGFLKEKGVHKESLPENEECFVKNKLAIHRAISIHTAEAQKKSITIVNNIKDLPLNINFTFLSTIISNILPHIIEIAVSENTIVIDNELCSENYQKKVIIRIIYTPPAKTSVIFENKFRFAIELIQCNGGKLFEKQFSNKTMASVIILPHL